MARVYHNQKFLLYPDRLAAIRDGKPCAPVHVRIKPTNRCNHDCWYCAYRADTLQLGAGMREADQLAPEKMLEIAQDLIALKVEAVTFSGGGEPLLYKPLPGIVELLATAGIRVGVLTNGSNLKGAMAEVFARYGTWVRVSLDAHDDASYAASRGVAEGRFSELLRNLRDFAARPGNCVLGASFIVTEANAPHIPTVCRMLKEAGVGHVKLSPVVVGNEDADNNSYHATIGSLVARQIERARELEGDGFHIVDHYH
jgi:MoaA/NifB/PqqE/SkfB family radical SAM enzyme